MNHAPSPAQPRAVQFSSLPVNARVSLFLLAAITIGFCVLMWPQWLRNPDLSHGLFMPVIFVVLLLDARRSSGSRFLPSSLWTKLLFGAALLLGLGSLALGGLYAAASEWSHPVVSVLLAVSLASLLGAGLVAGAQENSRLIPFSWSAVLAAGLWVLCAPVPPGTYSRLTLGLQLWVTENVLSALHWLGIVASRHGNIIELTTTSVGVEEACSGVRSLISCVFAGLFFSACLIRRPWHRVLIVVLSAPLALAMNFLRSLTLTLLANRGVEIAGAWHDWTGFAVLGLTALILGFLALSLARGEDAGAQLNTATTAQTPNRGGTRWQTVLASALALAVAGAAFFGLSAHHLPSDHATTAPNLEAILPTAESSWAVTTASDLNRFADTLRTDRFVQRTYVRTTPTGPVQITIYVAYWLPGQATASQVATHTPDACWPGAGWEPVPAAADRQSLHAGGRDLSPAEHRLFISNGYPQQVWFWHIYDRRPVEYLDPLSPRNVIKLALRHGFHRDGDQMFVRVSSNRPWTDLAAEPLIAEVFAQLQPLGL